MWRSPSLCHDRWLETLAVRSKSALGAIQTKFNINFLWFFGSLRLTVLIGIQLSWRDQTRKFALVLSISINHRVCLAKTLLCVGMKMTSPELISLREAHDDRSVRIV
jgi:hypothetical protein